MDELQKVGVARGQLRFAVKRVSCRATVGKTHGSGPAVIVTPAKVSRSSSKFAVDG